MFSGIGEGFTQAFPGGARVISGLVGALTACVGWVEKLFAATKIADDSWHSFGLRIGQISGQIYAAFYHLPEQLYKIGSEMIQRLWDGITAKWGSFLSDMKGRFANLKNSLSFWKSETATSQTPNQATVSVPARAKGGTLFANTPTLVGENGPELITSSQTGWVHTAKQTQSLLSPSGNKKAAPNLSVSFGNIIINGIAAPEKIAQEVIRHLENKTKSAMRALHADLEYTS